MIDHIGEKKKHLAFISCVEKCFYVYRFFLLIRFIVMNLITSYVEYRHIAVVISAKITSHHIQIEKIV